MSTQRPCDLPIQFQQKMRIEKIIFFMHILGLAIISYGINGSGIVVAINIFLRQ